MKRAPEIAISSSECRECRRKKAPVRRKNWLSMQPIERRRKRELPVEKACSQCKEIKPLSEFHRATNSTSISGRRSSCHACRSRVPASKARLLRQRYGITHEEYMRKYEEQGGKCAICGLARHPILLDRRQVPSEILVIDHDHREGKVKGKPRGLLCTLCNQGIGLALENPAILDSMKAYLAKHGAVPRPCPLRDLPDLTAPDAKLRLIEQPWQRRLFR